MLDILQLRQNGIRDILLCTDNRNVLRRAEPAKSNAPTENRVLRALNLFCLHYQVDVIPVYVRSGHNSVADGLTRRSEHTANDCSSREGTTRANAAEELWAHMSIPYNTLPLAPSVPGTFSMLAEILTFFQRFNRYRAWEWRPRNYLPGRDTGELGMVRFLRPINREGRVRHSCAKHTSPCFAYWRS